MWEIQEPDMSQSLFPRADQLGLLTDLYELTMAAGYFVHGMADQEATFELWFRRLPAQRNYLVAAGLEQVVHYLQHFSFDPDQIRYLREHPAFRSIPDAWFERLGTLRFDGDLWAVPEGTPIFPGEPVLRVTGPIMLGQIVETFLITSITMQTLVASKAARAVQAAQGRPVVDFGSRRAHGPQAGLLAARAAYLAGCAGTSNAEAGRLLGIDTLGTQAHAWIMAFDDEKEAFRVFSQIFPDSCVLLIDTYDTLQGARNALLAGEALKGVRLDSGNLIQLSRQVRKILNDAGRCDVKIIASGDLNEYKIHELLERGGMVDTFGVGTELVTSRDDPTLTTVYKLVEQRTHQGRRGKAKLAEGKKTYPSAKQVYRLSDTTGVFLGDVVAGVWETGQPGRSLLQPILKRGELIAPLPTLKESKRVCREQLQRLPARLHQLDPSNEPYPIRFSEGLEAELQAIVQGNPVEAD
jgi:nicotinate phosphoribosyltransferase